MNNLNIWQQLVEQSQLRWKEVIEATSVPYSTRILLDVNCYCSWYFAWNSHYTRS